MSVEVVTLFGVVFIGMLLRIPVFIAILVSCAIQVLYLQSMPVTVFVQKLVSGIDQPALAAIPYFFLVGTIMNAGGLSQRLIDLARATLGGVRGALAQINIGGSLLFGGMTGSAAADVSAIGAVMIPAMKKDGYPASYSAAVTATSASIGLMIPPSIPMVMFGLFNQVSVGKLFVAGIIPGILMCMALMMIAAWQAAKHQYAKHARTSWQEWIQALKRSFWVLLLPVVVFVTIAQGIATVTEVGAIAVFYAAFVSTVVYRAISPWQLVKRIAHSALESGQILSLLVVSGSFLWILASLGATDNLLTWLTSLQLSSTELLLMVACLLLLIGTVIGPGLQMILLIPTVFPLMIEAGIDAVHFGVVAVLASALGLVTPPIGFLVFMTAAQAQTSSSGVFVQGFPFLLALITLLLVLIYFPALSTFLPSLIFSR